MTTTDTDPDVEEMGDGEYEDAPSTSRRSSAASATSATAPHDEKNNILWKKCFAITIDGSVCHVVRPLSLLLSSLAPTLTLSLFNSTSHLTFH